MKKNPWKVRGGGVLSEIHLTYFFFSLPWMVLLTYLVLLKTGWGIALAFFFLYPLTLLKAVWLYDRGEDAWNDCRARFFSVFEQSKAEGLIS